MSTPALITSVILGAIFTWMSRKFALAYGIVNYPNAIVPQHVKPTAYLGGVGICLAVTSSVLCLTLATENSIPTRFLFFGFVFMVLGAADDLLNFSPLKKLLGQVILACLATAASGPVWLTGITAIDFFLSTFWILLLVNACNLTDVCDGLVAGLSVIIFGYAAMLYSSGLTMICAGATSGFLIFNFPPASIFLGDAGSHYLGFSIAWITLQLSTTIESASGLIAIAVLPSVFLFELIFLVTVRYRKGLKFWLGSPDHFSLRIQATGKSKLCADLTAWALGGLSGLPLIAIAFPIQSNIVFSASWLFVSAVMAIFWWYLIKIEKHN